jgi:methylated-DNA-[protein]-cysteine S-methyltransferase
MGETTSFQERVYAKLRQVPRGKVTTYGDLAKAVRMSSAQAIGQAMRHNPYAPDVPCHRVVASDGTIGGFSGARRGKKIREKILLLATEGVMVRENTIVDFEKIRYRWGH